MLNKVWNKQSVDKLIAELKQSDCTNEVISQKINEADIYGRTPLHGSIESCDIDNIQWLIDNGANINVSDNQGGTPLHHAALFNRSDVAELLISKGANLNKTNIYNITPLMVAKKSNSTEVVNLLIRSGSQEELTTNNPAPFLRSKNPSNPLSEFCKYTSLCGVLVAVIAFTASKLQNNQQKEGVI